MIHGFRYRSRSRLGPALNTLAIWPLVKFIIKSHNVFALLKHMLYVMLKEILHVEGLSHLSGSLSGCSFMYIDCTLWHDVSFFWPEWWVASSTSFGSTQLIWFSVEFQGNIWSGWPWLYYFLNHNALLLLNDSQLKTMFNLVFLTYLFLVYKPQ